MKQASQLAQKSHLSHLSQLDHLRPPPGWRTDCAVLSSYSAHTSVITAALLALVGQDDDTGSGTKIALAHALTKLRGKVHFVVQNSRLTSLKHPLSIVSMLDRFTVKVPWDEGSKALYQGKSWHAKFALVRQVPELAGVKGERWVFMLGSRNLTLDTSWDIGLVLKAGDDTTRGQKTVPQAIDGIGQIAIDLARLFPKELLHWSSLGKSLGDAKWQVPIGLNVTEIRLLLPDAAGREMPKPSADAHRVLAVSPFLDAKAVAEVAGWGGEGVSRQLLSTNLALKKLTGQQRGSLSKFDTLLTLPAPDHEIILGTESSGDDEQIAADQLGLHAKILFTEHAKGSTMWFGSPNLSSRAWTRNAECFAKIHIQNPRSEAGKQLCEGLDAFIELATTITLDGMDGVTTEIPLEQRLAQAWLEVAARLNSAEQTPGKNNALVIKCNSTPHPDDLDIVLSCSPLTGQHVAWPQTSKSLEFVGAANSISASDFLSVRLSLDGHNVEWLQIVPWNPPLGEGRDEAVLSEYLGPRQMLSWIHEVLYGYANGDEGGDWKAPRNPSRPRGKGAVTVLGLPSIDQALRMWLKNKAQLNEVDRILEIWTKKRKTSAMPNDEEKDVEIHLQRFSRSWKTLRKGLRKDLS
jgi:hypothetical protein